VIGADERQAADRGLGAVPEARPRRRHRLAQLASGPERGVPGEAAERHHDADSRQRAQLAHQIRLAAIALLDRRPVVGRRAADRGCHVAVAQLQPVGPPGRGRLVGESGPVERAIQPVPGAIAGEDATGAISAVRGRRQAQHQEARARVAEAGYRPGPVGLAAEAKRRGLGGLLPPGDQARAERAPDHVRGDPPE
jgi:hypothetical protein